SGPPRPPRRRLRRALPRPPRPRTRRAHRAQPRRRPHRRARRRPRPAKGAEVAADARTTEIRFRAMGTDVHVVIVGARPGMPELARRFVEDLEDRWSRFRSTSEISMLNALAGLPVRVSTETLVLVELALVGADRTGGRYDPTVLGAVLRAGYDRSFEHLPPVPASNGSTLEQGYERIAVDHAASTVTMPA